MRRREEGRWEGMTERDEGDIRKWTQTSVWVKGTCDLGAYEGVSLSLYIGLLSRYVDEGTR